MIFNKVKLATYSKLSAVLLSFALSSSAFSAIVVDRTRIVVDKDNVVTAINVRNKNDTFPFLAQSWIEDEKGEKINKYFTVIPPIQRVEPDTKSMIRIQRLEDYLELPQDRESLFYFNVREIPPQSNAENLLQIALQTKLKLFYRPKSISNHDLVRPFREVKVSVKDSKIILNNPTPYYLALVALTGNDTQIDIDSENIAPFSQKELGIKTKSLNKVSAVFIDDFGGKPNVNFNCDAQGECHVIPEK